MSQPIKVDFLNCTYIFLVVVLDRLPVPVGGVVQLITLSTPTWVEVVLG